MTAASELLFDYLSHYESQSDKEGSMNYGEARQRSDKSGWAFTIQNDDDIWTAPCCRTEEKDAEGYRAHKHATREEAEACFNAWRRDPQGIKLNDWEYGDWTSCEVCGDPTKAAATHNDLGGRYRGVALCADHMTVENVQARIEDITWSCYS